MARDPSRNAAQAHALYAFHQQGNGRIERSARRLAISPRTMYALTENELSAPASIIGPMWDEYGDAKLVTDLIGPTTRPFVFSAAPAAGTGGTTAAANEVIREAAETIAQLARDLADGKLDDKPGALKEAKECARALQTLIAGLEGMP